MPTTQTVVVGGRAKAVAFQKYVLKVQPAEGAASEVTAEKQRFVIGSDAGCDLVLTDPGVSRNHCEIRVAENGYIARDLGSKNGTRVNGVPIIEAFLTAGSKVEIGDSVLEFEPSQEVSEIPLYPDDSFGSLIGPSLAMRALFAVLDRVAPENITVLVEGESGVGKELVAEEIHAHSGRKGELVVFDCSAVPENLVESELFGHVKGAFTGATSDREGAFRQANGGTLFLDEIGELTPELQPKLLRALESRKVKPVGGSKQHECDVRVIAATNRNLAEEVKKGAFRQDLYFRLNVVKVEVPPLRRRPDDIKAIAESFLRAKNPDDPAQIGVDVLHMLLNHDWPGNVRELKNFVDRYHVFAPTTTAGAAQLLEGAPQAGRDSGLNVRFDQPYKDVKADLIHQLEIEYFGRLLTKHNGNVAACAREAGMHRKYLEELVRKHDLKQYMQKS